MAHTDYTIKNPELRRQTVNEIDAGTVFIHNQNLRQLYVKVNQSHRSGHTGREWEVLALNSGIKSWMPGTAVVRVAINIEATLED